MADSEIELLRRIVEQQQRQIEIASEALEMQRQQIARVQDQLDRADRIQARAETIQARGMRVARIVVYVLIPVLLFLCGTMLAPYLRYWYWLARH